MASASPAILPASQAMLEDQEMVRVRVLRKEGVRGIKLIEGTEQDVPEFVVNDLAGRNPPVLEVIGEPGQVVPVAGRLTNDEPAPAARRARVFVKLEEG